MRDISRLYTLDNRRLAVFRLLSILERVQVIKMRVVQKTKEWEQKFNTTTDGTVVRVRGTPHVIGMDKQSTTYPLHCVRIPPWCHQVGESAQKRRRLA